MVLLGPAAGYGDLADKDHKLRGRLEQLEKLGPEGMARERSPTLVAKGSPPFALELVRWSQRRIRPQGYRQAVHCLAQGCLAVDARRFPKKVLVACGSEVIITPEASCKPLAAAFPRGEYRSLPGIGHAPHIEAPELINPLIAGFVPTS
jgi:pimeloyl-ACP methyl ester carboxylesterase